jgi:hypothetical protein
LDADRQLPSVRDRKSEFRDPGSNAKVTARGDPGAPASANAVDRRNRRHLALFERAQHAIDPCLVVDGILRGVECAKLIDVGAGRECLVACAGEDQHLEGTITGRGFAYRCKPFIHVEGQRISRLRPVEGDPADAIADLVKQMGIGGSAFIHVAYRPPSGWNLGSAADSIFECKNCHLQQNSVRIRLVWIKFAFKIVPPRNPKETSI